MDNVTHALAGMVAAELVVQRRGGRDAGPPRFARAAYWVSALANNVPDLDLVYLGITGGKIGYLVHHRGHTHTLAFALPLALLTLLPLWAYARRQRAEETWSKADLRALFGLALLGPVLHLAMDATNNYGVHPFWPLDNRWYYGDAIFIVEPLLWASVAPPLFFAVRARLAKALFAVIAVAGIGLSAASGMVPMALVVGLALWTAGVTVAALRLPPARRGALAVGAAALVYLGFGVARARAKATVAEVYAQQRPDERLDEVVAAPGPANPLCWMVIGLSRDEDQAVLRRGLVAPFGLPELCPGRVFDPPTIPFAPSTLRDHRFRVEGTYRARLRQLRDLAERCHAAAFLQWSRAPFWTKGPSGEVLGDLRYDFGPDLGWAEVALPEGDAPCPPALPAWRPPRSDWLEETR